MDSREELRRNWLVWVTTNLGRDTRLAEIAATAATDAVAQGLGFTLAAEAAKSAWREAAKPSTIKRLGVEPKWEKLAILAWIPLGLAWLWPIVAVVLSRATDWSGVSLGQNMALLDVVAIPGCAAIAIVIGHSARADIKGTDRRRGDLALVALVMSYIALIGAPIWIVGFIIAAGAFPIVPFGA